jgi:Common central domain of tyrosinase
MTLGDGIRRNIATITQEERNRLVAAFRKLDDQNDPNMRYADGETFWDKQEDVHKAAHTGGQDVHGGPAFLAWHRELCNRLEALLRKVDPQLSLHYWDWTTDPLSTPDGAGGTLNLFTHSFMGNDGSEGINRISADGGGDAGIPFQDFETTEGGGHQFIWRDVARGLPLVASDHDIITAGDGLPQNQQFTQFDNVLQAAHNYIHSLYIRGTIGDAHFSFHDPFVFLLHSNVDRLWAMWQRTPGQSWRLNPNTTYGQAGGAASINATLGPWDGSENLFPWTMAGGQIQSKTSKDPSVVLPPSYDTVPHSSFIITDRDTFSVYEVESTANYPRAFYVIYDGFAPNELGSPIAPPTLSFTFDSPDGPVATGMSAILRQIDFEDPNRSADLPQRIVFTFDLHFDNSSAFSTFTETRNVNLRATQGTEITNATLHLIKQPNPYMVDGPVTWLSTDIRVFKMQPGMVRSTIQQQNPETNSAAPFQFIQSLLANFNSLPNDEFHPFFDISLDQQASQLELSRTVNGVRVLNYAVAKVRYRANSVAATNVKVFFRMFSTMLSALDYNTSTNYHRAGTGDNAIPLLGLIGNEIASIPFFAEPRVDSANQDMSAQVDNFNRHTINPIPAQESVAYFGCWLDFNQTEPQFPLLPSGDGHFTNRLPILQLIRGHHQCLVAEIYFQPGGTDPIPFGATPASSDRLAQRNLAIVESDNPGNAATHTVQHTFMVKPSRSLQRNTDIAVSARIDRFRHDELIVHWNDLPRDTKATLYFPEWNIDEVLAIASQRQRPNVLKKLDEHTLEFVVSDISFIPIPGGSSQNYAGLISLELPQNIRDGQFFTVDVQQYSGITQKVIGSFQLAIPVRLGPALLQKEIRKLAVLRYIAESIPTSDRWHLVFIRYLNQISNKIRGLGGDPDAVKATPDDPSRPETPPKPLELCFTGKICEVIYDCFGDFEGFVLDTCAESLRFKSREKGIDRIILRACRERMVVTICTDSEPGRKIRKVILQCQMI